MNIRDLRYLIAVADTHHFGRAADRCFVSQPTLSGQIKKLEDELGTKIFERSNRSVQTTPAGEAIIRQAHLALEQIDLVSAVASQFTDPMAGTLRLGMIPTLAPYLVPLVIKPMSDEYPRLDLVITEETTDILIQQLREHQLDAVLLATAIGGDDVLAVPLFDEPFWLVHPRDHQLYCNIDVSLGDLKDEQILLLSDAHCLSGQVAHLCQSGRGKPGLRASSMETLLQLVAAGFGCTLVPALTTGGAWTTDMGLITKRIRNKQAKRRVSLVYRKTFPYTVMLDNLYRILQMRLPNTVTRLDPRGHPARRPVSAIPSPDKL